MNVEQTNINKSLLGITELRRRFRENKNLISLTTEPYTYKGRIRMRPLNTITIADETGTINPRAAIFASKHIDIIKIESLTNKDCVTALLTAGDRRLLLSSIYMDIKKPVEQGIYKKLMDYAKNKSYDMLMGIDTNAHSHLFSRDSNKRGEDLEDWIMANDLKLENIGMTPTFDTFRDGKRLCSVIDITLSKSSKPDLVTDWHVDTGYNGSDHKTIKMKIEGRNPEQMKIRRWNKGDWTRFKNGLARVKIKYPKTITKKNLDLLVAQVYRKINKWLNKTCPLVKKSNRKLKDWYTTRHEKKRKAVIRAYNRLKNNSTPNNNNSYKIVLKEYKKMCNKSRNKAWNDYREKMKNEEEMAKAVKYLEERTSIVVGTLEVNNETTKPGEETINELIKQHFPHHTQRKRIKYDMIGQINRTDLEKKYKDWINPELIKMALAKFVSKKSPGPDNLKPIIFKHLPHNFIAALNLIYKGCIHLRYTPKKWRETRVIFIGKPGKDNYRKAKSFRPISLSNYMLKGLERLVVWRMDRALERYPINNRQHGFTKGKSTESAISNTVDYIEQCLFKNQQCIGIFLDISSAFDTILPEYIASSLRKHGADEDLVEWYLDYLKHRDMIIDLHGDTKSISNGIGFPQGGVASAKFWLIAFNEAVNILNTNELIGNAYADDCSGIIGGQPTKSMIRKLEKTLNELIEWGNRSGLKFNEDKTVVINFTRKRKCTKDKVTMNGKTLEYADEVKYLGVHLDSGLTWKKHIEDKIIAAKRLLYKTAKIAKDRYGPKPKLMRWAYQSVARTRLTYGCIAWGQLSNKYEKQLRRVNRMAINTIVNVPRSTPTRALEILLNIKPLHLQIQYEGLKAYFRLKDQLPLSWEGLGKIKRFAKSHLRFWADHLENIDIPEEIDNLVPITEITTFNVNLESMQGQSKYRTMSQYNIYTDGSKLDGKVGAGFAIYRGREEIANGNSRLHDDCTVFQAELKAIYDAVTLANTMTDERLQYIKIFCDSQAAMLAIRSNKKRTRLVDETIKELNRLMNKARRLTIVWTKAHVGTIGNERADELAKIGTKCTNYNNHFIPITQAKHNIKAYVLKQWDIEWQKYPEAKQTKQFISRVTDRIGRKAIEMGRMRLSRFVRIITGHNALNWLRNKISPNDFSNICRFCRNNVETFWHLATDCPVFRESRNDIFLDKDPSTGTWNIDKITQFSYLDKINNALIGIDDLIENTWAAHIEPEPD